MAGEKKIGNIGFLSTYFPRECGLATFTEDLVNELCKITYIQTSVIAVVDKEELADEVHPVKYRLQQHERTSYLQAALWINDHIDLLIIEHEYGIFGGACGEYILDLVEALKIPFIITTHTVLVKPTYKQQIVLRELGRMSAKVVVMAKSSIPVLVKTYSIAARKITYIPHGVPDMHLASRDDLKIKHNLQHKAVVSSFGLISPAKGLEYGIEAIAKAAGEYKNLVYLILGKTHPAVKKTMGEDYRQSLMNLAQRLGVQENVRFIDKYLTKEEVMTYLYLSDMYLTPYLSKEQAVSGTLAYAMGCGRVIISTPYRYAEEMLSGGRGMLAEFKDADSIATCIKLILDNPEQQKEMEQKTLQVGKTMTWAVVASQYADLCMKMVQRNRQLQPQPRPYSVLGMKNPTAGRI